MEVDFVKLSPTENMTVLVTSPVEREKQLRAGTELIKYSSVHAEQAGFMEKPQNPGATARLQMMAGEFCGNGAMSAAVYEAEKMGIGTGETRIIPLEVSGADGVLDCTVTALDRENGIYSACVDMPLPLDISRGKYFVGGIEHTLTAVRLPGITHIIIPREILDEQGIGLKELEASVYRTGEDIEDDAFGLMVFEAGADVESGEITPLVAVRSAKSLCWERGCGSGSEAVGAYMAHSLEKSIKLKLKQPGGIIETSVIYENGIKKVSIRGMVKICARGKAFVDC